MRSRGFAEEGWIELSFIFLFFERRSYFLEVGELLGSSILPLVDVLLFTTILMTAKDV
jgi:hypothetical protein